MAETDSTKQDPAPVAKDAAAVALGRRGGLRGGVARAERLSPAERSDSAKKAAESRWMKKWAHERLAMRDSNPPAPSDSPYPTPFAKFPGELSLGGESVDCYVLDTGERVISLRAAVKSIAGEDHGKLGNYIGVAALKDFIDSH